MSDAPMDILRRLAERKKTYTGYQLNELNELNEIIPPSRTQATSGSQPIDGAPSEAITDYEKSEITQAARPATSGYQPTTGTPGAAYTDYELNELNEIIPSAPKQPAGRTLSAQWREGIALLDPDRPP